MPKLNVVLMVVLSLALIGGLGALVLRTPAVTQDQSALDKAFRKLVDSDPDVRREAEGEIRAMGPRGMAALKEAARSSDRTLAARASKLLAELQPPAPAPVRSPSQPDVPTN